MSQRPFEARYEGFCRMVCGSRIEVGDLVVFTDDGLMHDNCADHTTRVERPQVVCQTCWLTKPCDCEDES